jgi:hypothetical protein
MSGRLRDCWASFRALPVWVQWWVGGLLIPVNALPFFLLDTPTGRLGAAASLVVVMSNVPVMLAERGMSRLLSIPHLIAWIPLCVALLLRAFSGDPIENWERALLFALLAVNGVSLLFDAIDSWRWLRGDREVPGRPVGVRAPQARRIRE